MGNNEFLHMDPRSKYRVYQQYSGLLVLSISVVTAVQSAWLIEHQRPDEAPVRLIAGLLVGLLVGAAVVEVIERLFPPRGRAISRRVAVASWPGFLVLFTPFHVGLLCRWQKQCAYLGDVFMLQAVVLGLGIFFAGFIYRSLEPKAEYLRRTRAGRVAGRCKFPLTLALTLGVLLVRGWERFEFPELFAEGGVVYLNGALRDGWSSLFETYTGFMHVFPRLVVLTGLEILPLEHLTRFTVTVSFVVAALVSANFVRDRYCWLVPSVAARISVCVLLTLVPGLYEILGNLTNLHYVMFVFVALALLRDPADESSSLELVCVMFAVLSTSLTIGLIPLAAYRVYLKRRRGRDASGRGAPMRRVWRDWALLAMLLFPLVWAAQDILLNPKSLATDPHPVVLGGWDLFEGLINVSTIYYLLFPLTGAKTINELLPYVPPYLLLAPLAAFIAVNLRARWHENRDLVTTASLWLAAMGAVVLMIYFARPVGFKAVFVDNWGHFAWWMRYHYLLAAGAIVTWFVLLRPRDLLDLRKTATVVVLVVISSGLFHSRYIFEIGRYTDQELWPTTAEKLQSSLDTGCPRTVVVEVFPNKRFTYVNPDSTANACPASNEDP